MHFDNKFISRCLPLFLFQVQVLRNAGEEVTLTVSFLKRAPAFLKLPLNEDCACKPLLHDKEPSIQYPWILAASELLCIEGDWQQLLQSALVSKYELILLPGLVLTLTSREKLLSMVEKTDNQAFVWYESVKLQVKQ